MARASTRHSSAIRQGQSSQLLALSTVVIYKAPVRPLTMLPFRITAVTIMALVAMNMIGPQNARVGEVRGKVVMTVCRRPGARWCSLPTAGHRNNHRRLCSRERRIFIRKGGEKRFHRSLRPFQAGACPRPILVCPSAARSGNVGQTPGSVGRPSDRLDHVAGRQRRSMIAGSIFTHQTCQ